MRILLATVGSRGDVQPLLALGLGLRAHGHEVDFSAPDTFVPLLRDTHGFVCHSGMRDVQALLTEAAAELTSPLATARLLFRETRRELAGQLEAMHDLVRGYDLVVSAALQMAASSACEIHGVPYRYVLYAPQLLPSGEHPPFLVPVMSLPAWLNRALHALGDWVNGEIMFRQLWRYRRAHGLPKLSGPLPVLLGGQPLLCCSPALARAPQDLDLPVEQTGALFVPDPPGAALEAELEAFLAAGPAPVYVGFGSMVDPDPGATATLVAEAAARADVRVVLCTGWSDAAQLDTPNVRVIRAAPHSLLLPRCAGAVHHGGAGTTHAAARAGVPQLLVPHLFDQFYFGARTFEAGVAVAPIPRPKLTAANLAAALTRLATDPALRAQARSVGERVAGQDGVAETVAALEASPAGPAARPPRPLGRSPWPRRAALLLALVAWVAFKWPPYTFAPWHPPPAIEVPAEPWLDPPAAHRPGATRLAAAALPAPEDVLPDGRGGVLASCGDGVIRRLSDAGEVTTFAVTHGRPLGMAWLPGKSELLVADAVRGLLRVESRGAVRVVVDRFAGRKLTYVDDVVVAPDGAAYVSDATARVGWHDDVRLEMAAHDPTGQVLEVRPDGRVSRLVGGLYFANGVALLGAHLLVNETAAYRVQRCGLKGGARGRCEVWIDRLPGLPDNLRVSPRGTVWLALVVPRRGLLDRWIHPHALGYWAMALAPQWALPKGELRGQVLELSGAGEPLRRLESPSGSYAMSTSAREHAGVLWLGHIDARRGGVLRLPLPK